MTEEKRISRRYFIAGMTASGAALSQGCGMMPQHLFSKPKFVSATEKMNIGIIGCGGKGESDLNDVSSENIIALCDVDDERAKAAFTKFPKAKRYKDFREMLEKEKTLEAVTVSTPDHVHALASIMAMKMGLHCFTQKPLTHDVYEARMMQKVAHDYKVRTQMGNQGTASSGLRRAVEIIQSGAIGPVREAHVWTNRPVWPQGSKLVRPLDPQEVPSTLDWKLWLAAAPNRPYNKGYVPFTWRGWWDFGTGALGDMACHTANMAFMALNLGYPTSIEAETSGINPQTAPDWAVITFQFPKRDDKFLPACKFVWYDGGKMPPQDLAPGQDFGGRGGKKGSGSLLVGDKGTLFSPDDYGERFKLLPEKDFEGYKAPEPTLPRSPGHHKEWIAACKGGIPALSNFDYAARLTETILLGNIALRVGKKMDWDGKKMHSPNCPEAEQYVKRDYKNGYSL